ncbi:choice-of-anchor D domain-containing protein [Herbiconiux sp. VKM Ac-1786]|uniref:choice-of-anchor D domain-containing protein n=1 Tax=Herbiconiux sp. VKM Ac-1786 TaxID=2783824 RepID=UPI00188D2019|nr:choice-of-anchor D domain-containing protein [Herbiconiux sp. VKM Ac-1786]MBF4572217.1 choice-of-anchor D domain-containing protein [Herbiconiux sp. VKM Ac-1786]
MFSLHRSRAAAVFAGALFAAAMLGGAVAPASAAPGDQISVSLPGLTPDFGYVKQGSVVPRTIELLNDGIDSITIDPAPLSALTSPYSLVSTTIAAGDVIAPGQRRTISVTLTAPPAPTVANQPVTLMMVSSDRPGMTPLTLAFHSESLTTARAHFDVKTPDGAATLGFGSVTVGTPVSKRLTLTVAGIDPLSFSEGDVRVTDSGGATVGTVRVTGSSFGAGTTYRPMESATVDLTFTPTAAGSVSGTITITGRTMSGNPEAPSVVVALPFTAAAAVGPTPTPTPTSTTSPSPTPTSTGTPQPTSSASAAPGAGGSGSGGVGAGSGRGGTTRPGASLASTGVSPMVASGFGLVMLLGGAAAVVLGIRRRRLHG